MGARRWIQWLFKVFPSSVVKNVFDLPSEEGRGGATWLLRGAAACALLAGSFLCSDYPSKCFHAFQKNSIPAISTRWVTRECITITCITCSCSLSSSALWSVGNALLTSLMHLFPTPCINCIFNYVGRKSHSETGNLPMHSFSAADLPQSHEDSLCPSGISPHLELIAFFPE